jgi:hypothetical protein
MVLRIFQTASGQWGGRLCRDGELYCSVGGCNSPAEVKDAIGYIAIDDVEVFANREDAIKAENLGKELS